MSLKEDTQRILDDTAEIARIKREIENPREPDDESPARPESEGEEWDRNTASNEDFLNRERHRA
jgi:hypothetical protein